MSTGIIAEQWRQIKSGGITVLIRKVRTLMLMLLDLVYLGAGVVLLGLIRIIRPIVHVRLVQMDWGRIGNWYEAAYAQIMRKSLWRRSFEIYFYVHRDIPPCNLQWIEMWRRRLRPSSLPRFWQVTYKLNNRFSDGHRYRSPGIGELGGYKYTPFRNEYIERVYQDQQLPIAFTSAEKKRGEKFLESVGLRSNEYIAYHNRDSAYLSSVDSSKDWSYHNYRDSRICNYELSMQRVYARKIGVARVGSVAQEAVSDPRFFDYPFCDSKSDFNDIFLLANCRVFVGSDTGVAIVPEVFKKPIVAVNFGPMDRIYRGFKAGVFIPKRFFCETEQREMTFREIYESGLARVTTPEELETEKVRLIENTPQEIADAVDELLSKLDGAWAQNEEALKLQHQYWDIADGTISRSKDFNISESFLLRNKHMLNGE